MSRFLLSVILFFSCAQILFAQVLEPAGSDPEMDLQVLEDQFKNSTSKNSAPDGVGPASWKKMQGGVWLLYSNSSVFHSFYKISQDNVFDGNVSESLLGIGGEIAFPIQGQSIQQFLLRAGFGRLSLEPSDEILEDYSRSELENKASLLLLNFLLKWSLSEIPSYGSLWWGVGSHVHYIFLSSRPADRGSSASQVTGSYGLDFTVAFGLDMPINPGQEAIIELQYKPMKSISLVLGIKSDL